MENSPRYSKIHAKRDTDVSSLIILQILFLFSTRSSDDVIKAFREAWTALRLLKSPEIAATYQEGKSAIKWLPWTS